MILSDIVSYLSYAPILRGFLALVVAGLAFPIAGVFVLRLNLIPLRFALMHGALLGGAVGLALGVNPLFIGILVDVAIVLTIAPLSRATGLQTGYITAFFMVLTVGLAFAVIYRAGVPAKDAFEIFWGNLFALTWTDLLLIVLFAGIVLGFILLYHRQIIAVLFNREIAFSVGIHEKLIANAILLVTGVTVAFSMRLIGALLLDSVLLLPALAASLFAGSMKRLFILASAIGVLSAVSGFTLSLVADLPASSSVTITASLILGVGILMKRLTRASRSRSTQ